ncbi:GntP family permease [Cytobacillus sp. FSL H8-0458]|uniref:GntP family permease n=1 Tax=Cytobacillus sp. FSL H8-0458 TaxID=2975346 RepID=UPI0030FC4C44
MVTGSLLLIIFILSLLALFLLILGFKWDAYLALLVVAVGTGIAVGIPLAEVPQIITTGFGNTLAGVGILIGLGIMLGQLMEVSGAIHKIAHTLLRIAGPKNSSLAVATTGLIVGIPLFFDAAFVILNGLIKNLSVKAKVSYTTLVLALAVGLITAYCLIIPTPAPLAVADSIGVDLGYFFIYGLIVGITGVFFGGYIYGLWLNRKGDANRVIEETLSRLAAAQELDSHEEHFTKEVSAFISFGVLALPILLIVLNTIFSLVSPGTAITSFFSFAGEKNMALLISVIFAAIVLKPYLKVPAQEAYFEAFKSSGLIMLITGAGGAFGGVIKGSGIGDYLVDLMQGWDMPIFILAFIFAQILRVALGSSTVSLITTSSILGPMILDLGVSPILLALAICAGGIGLSMPNDSGFWVVSRFSGMTVTQTLKTWSIGGFIAGVSALVMVYILSLGSGFLPGL